MASTAPRVPHILNVAFDGVDGESLMSALPDLAVSTGAACNSALGDPSYVLRALGRSVRQAESSLRFSFGRFTTRGRHRGGRRPSAPQRCSGCAKSRPRRPDDRGGDTAGGAGRELSARGPGAVFALAGRRDPGRSTGTVLRGEAGQALGRGLGAAASAGARDTVIEARFQALGCPHTLATASWLASSWPGAGAREAQPGSPRDWAQTLGVPVEKLGRLLLIEDALHAALQQWP